jgi:indolepyruvate ferredoxin oxidoreductase alpha subunit
MEEYANTAQINKLEYKGDEVGVITSGVAYQYAKEAFGDDVSFLKLGMAFPVPGALIKEFAARVKKLYVVEEMDPYLERHVRELGIECEGKSLIPKYGELNADIVRKAVFGRENKHASVAIPAIARPPVLCAGCPHRGFFTALSKRKNIIVTSDIGCYTLGSAPPLSSIDTVLCMGASISMGHGAAKAMKNAGGNYKVVAVIGDSTFFHTGIGSLLDVVYNKGDSVSVILDNRITGMTGHQQNPGTGFTLAGEPTAEVDIEKLCLSIGVKESNIYTVNPLDLEETGKALDDAIAKEDPTVIIARWPCILKRFSAQDRDDFDLSPRRCNIDRDRCRKCGNCVRTGCPAIRSAEYIEIDPVSCTGCAVCKQVCPFDAIREVEG